MPEVRKRDQHHTPTPRVGGIAIVVTFIVITLFLYFNNPNHLSFVGDKFWGIDRNLFGLVISIILLSLVNVADDFRSTPVWLRLLTQIIAAMLIVYFGIQLPWITNPFGGHLVLGNWGPLLIVLWLVGLSNVTNWLDGLNGLTDGVGIISLTVLFFLSIGASVNQPSSALICAIAAGALVGFLPFNLTGRAFLGDTGSVFIGFLVGVMAIISGGKVATAFLVLALPLLDALVVFFSRIIHHQSPFQADRRHLHHRLLDMGLKPWQVVLLFYAVTLLFGLLALNSQALGKVWAILLAVVLMAALVLLYSIKGIRNGAKNR